jgi:hypothetical protein
MSFFFGFLSDFEVLLSLDLIFNNLMVGREGKLY